MRKYFVLFLMTLIMTVSVLSVLGGPEPGEDEVAIMSGGSSSASASVNENGTEWRSEIKNINSSCMSRNTSVELEFNEFEKTEEGQKISFSGTIPTSNPCTTLDTDISRISDNVYRMELMENTGNGKCITCLGLREIEGSFTAETNYTLEITKDGDVIEEVKSPVEVGGKNGESTIGSVLSFLKSLFIW